MAKPKVLKEFISPEDHYLADAWVVFCADNRFAKVHIEALKGQGVHVDSFQSLGGIKHLASPKKPSHLEFALDQLQDSIDLHQTKKVVLIAHLHCGAYKDSVWGMADQEEIEFYFGELKKARENILEKHPDIAIKMLYIDFHRIYEVEEL